jgi:hypothetical protein
MGAEQQVLLQQKGKEKKRHQGSFSYSKKKVWKLS